MEAVYVVVEIDHEADGADGCNVAGVHVLRSNGESYEVLDIIFVSEKDAEKFLESVKLKKKVL